MKGAAARSRGGPSAPSRARTWVSSQSSVAPASRSGLLPAGTAPIRSEVRLRASPRHFDPGHQAGGAKGGMAASRQRTNNSADGRASGVSARQAVSWRSAKAAAKFRKSPRL